MMMMKLVISLGVLLHLCCTAHLDFNLNKEIIDRLMKLHLDKSYSFNSTQPLPVMLVDKGTQRTCIHTFAKELSLVLSQVTVPERSESLLLELRANLKALSPAQEVAAGDPQEVDQKCHFQQKMMSNTSLVFKRYATFLRLLNNMKTR